MNRLLPRLAWISLGAVVLLFLGLIAARVWFDHYLHSEEFRRTLGDSAANSLRAAHAEFTPLQFDGGLVYAGQFLAEGSDGAPFSSMRADDVRASFDWHGLLRRKVQIDELAIQRLVVAPPSAEAATRGAPPPAASSSEPGAPRWTVDLRKAVVNNAEWSWAPDAAAGGISGVALTFTPESGNAWSINAAGGRLRQEGWPALDIESAQLRWQSPVIYVTSSSLRNGSSHITATGSVEPGRTLELQVKLDGVDIQPLIPADWKKRIDGRLFGDVTIQASLGTGEVAGASGKLTLTDGHLTALPILDEIGVFTRTQRFRQLDLTRASADFTRTPARIDIRNLVLESAGLIRIEGECTIEGGEIAGTFQVGLTPSTLQWIPGSQDRVFLGSHDGYLWAPMKVSGPVGSPVDDLTPRLAAAAANGVIENVEGAVKKAGQGVLDLLLH